MKPDKKRTPEEIMIAAQDQVIEALKKNIALQAARIQELEEQLNISPAAALSNEQQISMADVEAIAYNPNTCEEMADACHKVLLTAKAMMRGEDPAFPDQMISPYRILFIKTSNNVYIYVD